MPNPPPEIPADLTPDGPWMWKSDPTKPVSALQALMEAAPNDTPRESAEELQAFREAVDDCTLALDEQSRFILNSIQSERVTHRELARRLGLKKSHTNRLIHKTNAELAPLLRCHPIIQRRYTALKPESWEQAAEDAVNYIRIQAATTLPIPMGHAISEGKAAIQQGWDNIPALRRFLIACGASAYEYLKLHAPDVTNTIVDTLIERHHKYGPGNIAEFEEIGLIVRMADKVARIKNSGADYDDETFLDAYVDLVGYAAIAHMLHQNTFYIPLEGTR